MKLQTRFAFAALVLALASASCGGCSSEDVDNHRDSGTPPCDACSTADATTTDGSTGVDAGRDAAFDGGGLMDLGRDTGSPDTGLPDAGAGCGDGIVRGTEECDEGDANGAGDDPTCLADCTLPQPSVCGDGTATGRERCDDGNTVNGDGCDSDCTPTGCANGIPTPGDLCLPPLLNFAVGQQPRQVATDDLNGDGWLDIVVVNYYSRDMHVILGTGYGEAATPVRVATPNRSDGVAIADMNGDGLLDVVVVGPGAPDGTVSVFIGDGTGSLGSPAEFDAGRVILDSRPILVDLDADGDLDVVLASRGADELLVLEGDGAGALVAPRGVLAGLAPDHIAAGDVDGDGDIDLLAAADDAGGVSVLRGAGDGSFGAPETVTTGLISGPFRLEDLDADGALDLIVGTQDGVAVHRGQGDGNFLAATAEPLNGAARFLQTTDLDGDQNLDIVVSIRRADLILETVILLGDGTGGFRDQKRFGRTAFAHIADWSADGIPDLLYRAGAPSSPGRVGVFHGLAGGAIAAEVLDDTVLGPPVGLGDFDGDGALDLLRGSGSQLNLQRGDGAGNFGSPTTFAQSFRLDRVFVADFDGDGADDVVTLHLVAESAGIQRSDGAGALEAVETTELGTTPYDGAIGDVDGDGDLDVVYVSVQSDQVGVLINDGTGTFTVGATQAAGDAPGATAIGDLDGDGNADFVVTNYVGDVVYVFLGDGTGAIGAGFGLATEPRPVGLTVGDFDLDGDQDLAVVSDGQIFQHFRNDGGGTFVRVDLTFGGGSVYGIEAQDLDDDGDLDIVVRGSGMTVLRNDAGTFSNYGGLPLSDTFGRSIFGDLNGDGLAEVVSLDGILFGVP